MNPSWHGVLGKGSNPDLSEREWGILRNLADGMQNEEIGDELGISRMTVMTHIKRILAKLGARNRTHAVAIGFRTGLLEVDE